MPIVEEQSGLAQVPHALVEVSTLRCLLHACPMRGAWLQVSPAQLSVLAANASVCSAQPDAPASSVSMSLNSDSRCERHCLLADATLLHTITDQHFKILQCDDTALEVNQLLFERLLAVDDVDTVYTNCSGLH